MTKGGAPPAGIPHNHGAISTSARYLYAIRPNVLCFYAALAFEASKMPLVAPTAASFTPQTGSRNPPTERSAGKRYHFFRHLSDNTRRRMRVGRSNAENSA